MKNKNSALYYEICMLKLLSKMGYIPKESIIEIAEIAAEDYKSNLIVNKEICCKC